MEEMIEQNWYLMLNRKSLNFYFFNLS
jgi:hypothetical protein